MADLLFKKGSFKILSDDLSKLSAKEMNALIKEIAALSHDPSEMTNSRHNWYTYRLGELQTNLPEYVGFLLLKANQLFMITPKAHSLIISGNSRIFNEGYSKAHSQCLPAFCILDPIMKDLHKDNPILFPLKEKKKSNVLPIFPYHFKLERNPRLNHKEMVIHRAMTVMFENVSLGFIYESLGGGNGDEKISYCTQQSTRYVDYCYTPLRFIPPYNDDFDFHQKIKFNIKGKEEALTPQEFTDALEAWYQALRQQGLTPQEVRQWLPLGLEAPAPVIQTSNLAEWHHWFCLHTSKATHPEIRFVANSLLKEVQKRIPVIFDNCHLI